jgi:hypothetical protein
LESIIRRLRINTLKAQVALRQSKCASLNSLFEAKSLTDEQRSEITRRRDESLEESYVLQLMVELLERQEREKLN